MSLLKKCPYSELFWSVFSRIRTEYSQIQSMFPYKSKCEKIRTRITPNMDTFHAVNMENCFKKDDISGNNKLFTENDFGNAFFYFACCHQE